MSAPGAPGGGAGAEVVDVVVVLDVAGGATVVATGLVVEFVPSDVVGPVVVSGVVEPVHAARSKARETSE